MPTYEYKCVLCEHIKDVTKSFDEANIVELCDKCGAAMIKQYGRVCKLFSKGYKTQTYVVFSYFKSKKNIKEDYSKIYK